MNTLNYLKMLEDINKLVENDFCADMEMNLIPNSQTGKIQEYKQEDSQKMASLLAEVYSVSHCIHCKACQKKYLNN